MPGAVRVDVLGPVGVTVAGRPVALGGRRQRSVLARLVLSLGRPVPADRLVEDVWGEQAPRTAHRTLHVYVARLRRQLGDQAPVLRRSGGGYVLDLPREAVDALRFCDAVREARDLAPRDPGRALGQLRDALSAWRGQPYADLADEPCLAGEIARLEDARLDAVELLAGTSSALGRPGEAVPVLEEAVASSPLREGLTRALVLALYRTGRQADALRAYERCRRLLAEELGVDPSPSLRSLHEAVLAQRPVRLTGAEGRPAGGGGPSPHLPPRNRAFAGREGLLGRVDSLLGAPGADRAAVLVLHGLGGAGKTQLALEHAHRRALAGAVVQWVPAADPVVLSARLRAWARGLGLGSDDDEDGTLSELLAHLARSRDWLLVLDDADSPDRVERFVPYTGAGAVLITSRNPAWRRLGPTLQVPVFSRPESTEFLRRRNPGAPAAALEQLAEVVGDLPLALEQASAYAESTGTRLQDYVALFTRDRPALAGRGTGGHHPGLATTWQLAFDRIDGSPPAARLLRLCAHMAAESIPLDLLAPHLDLAADDDALLAVADAVGELLRYSLVERDESGLRMHRLVQGAARDRLPAGDRGAVVDDVVGVLTAAAPGTPGDPGAWPAWERLLPHVLAVAGHAEAAGTVSTDPLVRLLRLAARYLSARAVHSAARVVLETALRLDPGARGVRSAELLTDLGSVLDAAGEARAAVQVHRRALAALDADPEATPVLLGRALARLGRALHCAGDGGQGVGSLQRALELLRGRAPEADLVPLLVDLGYACWSAHQLPRAAAAFTQALAAASEGGGTGRALALSGLAVVRQDEGDVGAALALQEEALDALLAAYGPEHPVVGEVLDKLAYAQGLAGRYAEAARTAGRAVAVLEGALGAGDPRVGMASTNHGLALLAIGDLRGARAAQERAVRLLRDAHGDGHLHVQLARRRLAGVLVGLGDLPAARDLLETALDRQLAATGPDDPDVGRTHALLALALRRSGETAAAARHADRAREVLGAALEESTPEVRLLRAVLEARVGTGAGRTG